jgi:hypothetical protein
MAPGRREGGVAADRAPMARNELRGGSRLRPPRRSGWVLPAVIGGTVLLALIVAIAVAVSRHNDKLAVERRRQEVFRSGCEATRRQVDTLRAVAQEYLDFRKAHPKDTWQARRLEAATLNLPAALRIEDVILLHNTILVASLSSGTPRGLRGEVKRSPDPTVDILYSAGGESNSRCVLFRSSMTVVSKGDFTVLLIAMPLETLE